MEPSITTKFLLPLVLTPVTVLTSAALVATMERPGSIMMVRPRSCTRSRTVSIRSMGVGSLSPLQQRVPLNGALADRMPLEETQQPS